MKNLIFRRTRENPSIVFTVDIEDWPQSTWDHTLEITQRAERNTEKLLELLSVHKKTITMFVLGKFAQRFPGTVKRIASEGHDIASHGYSHIAIFNQTPIQFREDIRSSKLLLEDLVQKPVVGYRAPDFSIISSTTWAFEILAEQGYKYDSSIFPIKSGYYGIEEWPTQPVQVCLTSGRSILELSLATITLFGRHWPVAGGGYHRLLPSTIIHWCINQHQQRDEPFVAYCHPYEFDPDEFAERDIDIPLKTRLYQGLGRRGFQAKFERMLKTFESIHEIDFLGSCEWPIYKIPQKPITKLVLSNE